MAYASAGSPNPEGREDSTGIIACFRRSIRTAVAGAATELGMVGLNPEANTADRQPLGADARVTEP